ncbi:MAG: DUF2071 domain-containing protein [Natronomonas sp.]
MADASVVVRGRDVLFTHWPIDPATLRRHVPDRLTIDRYDGTAWVSVLAHEVTGVRIPGIPGSFGRSFPQLNLRTYVRHRDKPGVYFLGCETGDRVGGFIARRLFDVPFHHASMRIDRRDGRVTFRSHRGRSRFDARYHPRGEATTVEPGTLAEFCIERYRWYDCSDGRVRLGELERDPWQIGTVDATIETNTLLDRLETDVPEAAVFQYSPGFEIGAERPSVVEGEA